MDLMDAFGLLAVLFTALLCLVAGFYAFVHFAHPDDKDFAGVWLVRGFIVAGIATVLLTVFLVPFDLLSAHER